VLYSSSEVVIPMSMLSYSTKLALFFGVSLAIIEVGYNWQNPYWWPYILVDYFAVSILIYGVLKSDRVLTAAWGFTCAMFYLSFFHAIEFGQIQAVVWGKTFMLGLTVIGCCLYIFPKQKGSH